MGWGYLYLDNSIKNIVLPPKHTTVEIKNK